MQDLIITLIQCPLFWESPEANHAYFEEKLWELKAVPDIVLLPEMFNTGFTMHAAGNAEVMGGKSFKWMKMQSERMGCVICGSLIIKEDSNYYNRLIWMRPDGSYETYDKRHLFRMGNEHQAYTPGKERLIVKHKGWRICPMICYDLRFPVFSRNIDQDRNFAYDLILFVANWPKPRVAAWDILLQARAAENVAYSVGLNRIGKDENGYEFTGHSGAYNMIGEPLLHLGEAEVVDNVLLSGEDLIDWRQKFPANLDADLFKLS